MATASTCSVCQSRKGKRLCPALSGNICAQCCAQGREESISCPFDCEYLVESRDHEKQQPLERKLHADIFPSPEFVDANQELFGLLNISLHSSIPEFDECIDRDLHDCLEGAVAHWRARAAGLEPAVDPPANPRGAAILAKFLPSIESLQNFREDDGRPAVAAKDMLAMLAFLRVFGQSHDNGRSRGRSFLYFIAVWAMQYLPEPEALAALDSDITGNGPLIV